MEYRELGKTGVKVSAIGFGCWAMGGTNWGVVDDNDSISAAQRALDLGITFFDTAPGYGYGHSEKILGEALADRRKGIFLATKCGMEWDDKGGIWRNSKPEYIRKDCERSLKNLRTDYVDLLQVHWPDEETPIADTMGEMAKLQKEGKIKFIGVSNFSVEQMKECQKYVELASLQPPYSMLRRGAEKEILPFCLEQKIGVVVYSPLQQGLLTGKFTEEPKFQKGDMRADNPFFSGENFKRIMAVVDQLKEMAMNYSKSVGQLAINWVLCNPAVIVAIVGAKRPAQVQENVGGAGWKIKGEDLKKIEEILKTGFAQ